MKKFVYLVFLSLLASLFGAQNAQSQSVINEYSLQADVWRPAKAVQAGVDAKGDMGLSIPVMTIPGRGIDFPIVFNYQAGIRVKQEAGWIGLGWSFDPGSISRDIANMTVGTGGSCTMYNVDYTTNPTYQQDTYAVTTPAGSFTMGKYKTGTGASPTQPPRGNTGDFYALEWEPWKIEYTTDYPVTVDGYDTEVKTSTTTTDMEDYDKFIVTAKDGTRYIFEEPTLSTFDGQNYHPSCGTAEKYVSTWRLVAILGADYEGTAIPTKNGSTVTPGSWVLLDYTTPLSSTKREK